MGHLASVGEEGTSAEGTGIGEENCKEGSYYNGQGLNQHWSSGDKGTDGRLKGQN